jgi:hypothetical protein
MTKLDDARRICDEYLERAVCDGARYRISDVALHTAGYAEPGYDEDTEVVAVGNWNKITDYDKKTGKFVDIDVTPAELGRALEDIGVAIEWCDEWTTCTECQKLVRTSPDSYSWTRSYIEDSADPDEQVCHLCVCENPTRYLEWFENVDARAWTINDVDPEDHGYRALDINFENGMYGGQADDPKLIAKALREMGLSTFIFVINRVDQFDMSFRVVIHEDEWRDDLQEVFEATVTKGPDPALQMQAALRTASVQQAQVAEPGIVYTKITGDQAVTRVVSPEEFVEGIKD